MDWLDWNGQWEKCPYTLGWIAAQTLVLWLLSKNKSLHKSISKIHLSTWHVWGEIFSQWRYLMKNSYFSAFSSHVLQFLLTNKLLDDAWNTHIPSRRREGINSPPFLSPDCFYPGNRSRKQASNAAFLSLLRFSWEAHKTWTYLLVLLELLPQVRWFYFANMFASLKPLPPLQTSYLHMPLAEKKRINWQIDKSRRASFLLADGCINWIEEDWRTDADGGILRLRSLDVNLGMWRRERRGKS